MTKIRRTISIALMIAVAVTFMPLLGGEVSAATKKPAKPKITSAKVNDTAVTVKWKKAKNAKKYQVGIKSTKKKWVKYKTVKKNAKNKKKYTKKNKYRVVAKGKKYVVYQYTYTYSVKGTTKKTYYKFKKLAPGKTHTLAVRSVNGKKRSAWTTVKRTIKSGDSDGPITKPGTVVPVTIGGTKNTLIIGKETTYNIPNTMGLNTELKSINITPKSVDIYDGEGADGSPHHSLTVEGVINGLNNSLY